MKLKVAQEYKKIKQTKYFEIIKNYTNVIKKCMKFCIEEEKIETENTIEIFVKYTDNKEIQIINNEYRNVDRETDVLSFPMYELSEIKNELENAQIPFCHLGDIIISIEKIEEQANEYGHSFERELIYLITHAMFHLLGYDHMIESEKKVMRNKEEKIMNKLNIQR